MTDNTRRTVLGAIALAPVIAAAPAAAQASVPADLSEFDLHDLLLLGSRNGDPAFAHRCADALEKRLRYHAAVRLSDDAWEAAERETPEYPAGLRYNCRYTHTRGERKGEVDLWEERCEPDGRRASMLWNMAHRRAKAAGVTYKEAEAQLRAEHAAWVAADEAAQAHYMVRELELAADAAGRASSEALRAVLDCPARNGDALLLKLHIRASAGRFEYQPEEFGALIADAARILGQAFA